MFDFLASPGRTGAGIVHNWRGRDGSCRRAERRRHRV